MPALYIAKSADVPRQLFAPGEKRAGFYFVTRRVYPMSAFLSSLFRFIFPRSSAFFAAAAAQSAFQSHRSAPPPPPAIWQSTQTCIASAKSGRLRSSGWRMRWGSSARGAARRRLSDARYKTASTRRKQTASPDWRGYAAPASPRWRLPPAAPSMPIVSRRFICPMRMASVFRQPACPLAVCQSRHSAAIVTPLHIRRIMGPCRLSASLT